MMVKDEGSCSWIDERCEGFERNETLDKMA